MEETARGRRYHHVIIGAGHNGLTTAAYLAKAGRSVLVLERRSIPGGTLMTESFGEGFEADTVWQGGRLHPQVVRDLDLRRFGYPTRIVQQPFTLMLGGGREGLHLDPDPTKAADSIRRFSAKDAATWPAFVSFMDRAARTLDAAYETIMPRLPRSVSVRDGLGLLEFGLDLRLMGRKDMLRFIRMLPMTSVEFLEEWFESPELKAALASLAVHGVTLGVMSAGTGFTLLHNWLNRGGLACVNVGGAGVMTGALTEAVLASGGEIRCDAEVKRVLVDNGACVGVLLEGGEQIEARSVISALDPKRTLLSLVGPMNLPPEFVWQTQSIKMRGSVAKLHLYTDGSHGVPSGTAALAPSMEYLERAYDTAKYGAISPEPYLEITTSGKAVSIHVQFAPYALKGSDWHVERGRLEELVLRALDPHLPNLRRSILGRKLLTPVDLEQIYGLTEGDLNHGQLMLDQFLFMRPLPGWSNHRTPIERLYLGGSGVHAGGGVSGAAGRNAARVVAREVRASDGGS